jgi:hypothetical protein
MDSPMAFAPGKRKEQGGKTKEIQKTAEMRSYDPTSHETAGESESVSDSKE